MNGKDEKVNSFSEYIMTMKYSFLKCVEFIKIDIKYEVMRIKRWKNKKESILDSIPYEYRKWKQLRQAKKNGCYEKVKEHYRIEDEIYQKYEVLSDSFAELKKPLKECDKKLAALRIMTKRMDEEESKYNDKFHIDQDGNRRLIAGECYHYLFYHTCVDGKVVNHREKVLTCIRDENGKYLLERNNGEQFWIGYDNLGWEADLYDV